MGRRRKWLNKVKRVLVTGQRKHRFQKHGNAPMANDEDSNVTSLRSFEQEPDMLVERTVDDTVLDIPWNILEEPYVVAPVEQHVCKLNEVVGSDENVSATSGRVSAELTRFALDFDEESAAILIQNAIRKYLAKKRLRGAARLKVLVRGSSTKRQTTATLQCMQTLSRVQSQIRARRIRMSEENQALQRQIQLKHEKEMENMKLSIGDDWNDSKKSREKLEASLRKKQEAGMRRERALAYAHSFQQKWRSGEKVANPVYTDPINPHWGWSWLERWMAARPWESTTALEQPARLLSVDEISKAYYTHRDRHLNTKKPPPLIIPQRQIRTFKTTSSPSNGSKLLLHSPRRTCEDDSSPKTICSVKRCKQQRRHSIASSSMSARTVASSEAHKARLQKSTSSSGESYGRIETGSLRSPGNGSVKKGSSSLNLSAARRHSGPPKVD